MQAKQFNCRQIDLSQCSRRIQFVNKIKANLCLIVKNKVFKDLINNFFFKVKICCYVLFGGNRKDIIFNVTTNK